MIGAQLKTRIRTSLQDPLTHYIHEAQSSDVYYANATSPNKKMADLGILLRTKAWSDLIALMVTWINSFILRREISLARCKL